MKGAHKQPPWRYPLTDIITEEEVPTHRALIHWARWCIMRGGPARAGSVEGRYDPEAGTVHEGVRSSDPLDTVMATEVNSALLAMPDEYRQALQMRYYGLHTRTGRPVPPPDTLICRRLGLRPVGYPAFMRTARLMLRNVLRSRKICI